MAITVTPDQADNARLLMALDKGADAPVRNGSFASRRPSLHGHGLNRHQCRAQRPTSRSVEGSYSMLTMSPETIRSIAWSMTLRGTTYHSDGS